jgi:hypothetical protein
MKEKVNSKIYNFNNLKMIRYLHYFEYLKEQNLFDYYYYHYNLLCTTKRFHTKTIMIIITVNR